MFNFYNVFCNESILKSTSLIGTKNTCSRAEYFVSNTEKYVVEYSTTGVVIRHISTSNNVEKIKIINTHSIPLCDFVLTLSISNIGTFVGVDKTYYDLEKVVVTNNYKLFPETFYVLKVNLHKSISITAFCKVNNINFNYITLDKYISTFTKTNTETDKYLLTGS